MSVLPISCATTAIAAIILVFLSLPVSLRRAKTGIEAGDGGDEILRRRIRAQGNFIEYTPIGLIVLLLAEASDIQSSLIPAIAVALIIGRILHATGMLQGSTPLRAGGMILTYLSLLSGSGLLLLSFL